MAGTVDAVSATASGCREPRTCWSGRMFVFVEGVAGHDRDALVGEDGVFYGREGVEVGAGERDGGEEVQGDDRFGLGTQERRPSRGGVLRRWPGLVAVELLFEDQASSLRCHRRCDARGDGADYLSET